MSAEEWRPVPGYEGLYSVSSLGSVMSMNYARTGMLKILMPGRSRGYLSVELHKHGTSKRYTVHRLVALTFLGERNGRQINHKSGVKTDNSLANLEYCTASENQKHSFRLGLQCNKGERHSQAKLTDEKIIDIRSRLNGGETQASIAKTYGIDQSAVSRIKSRELWNHVKSDRKAG